MGGTIVVLVNGEVLADGHGARISDQRANAAALAEGLLPLFAHDLQVVVLHGNKPQVGFVLFRSELASHALHSVPLDVCGADTQGATGYILSQAFQNILKQNAVRRQVVSVVTQTLVDADFSAPDVPVKAIGPRYDREKAEQFRQGRGWTMLEEPGRGYRRAVPLFSAREILEMESIKQLVASGDIVIAGGGGGIPVIRNRQGEYEGIEAVVSTEQVAQIFAKNLAANILLMVIENDEKFILSGLTTEGTSHLDLDDLRAILQQAKFQSSGVLAKLQAACQFLEEGGEQVVITTLRKLPDVFAKHNGLRIGSLSPSVQTFQVHRTTQL
jgi:carbamate kinase